MYNFLWNVFFEKMYIYIIAINKYIYKRLVFRNVKRKKIVFHPAKYKKS